MEANEQRRIAEALILAATEPISVARLAQIIPDCTPSAAKDLVNELNTEYQEQDRSFEIWEVAGGYQIRTRAEFSGYLLQLRKERPLRLSRPALETLAIIAYKQPVTRGEVEMVRGVDTGAVVKGLLDRRLVRLLGHREVPGRPMLYGTSRRFLEVFGLDSLEHLPTLRELEELARDQNADGLENLEGADARSDEEGEPEDSNREAQTGLGLMSSVEVGEATTLREADEVDLAEASFSEPEPDAELEADDPADEGSASSPGIDL